MSKREDPLREYQIKRLIAKNLEPKLCIDCTTNAAIVPSGRCSWCEGLFMQVRAKECTP